MLFTVQQNEKELISVNVTLEKFLPYYQEIVRRFMELSKIKTEEEKQEFLKSNYLCDIDLIFESRVMSMNTFQDFINFITD